VTHLIAELLERGIPEPTGLLDPAELLSQARRRVRRRRLAGTGALATVVVGALALPQLIAGSRHAEPGAVPGLSALGHTASLPSAVLTELSGGRFTLRGDGVLAASTAAGDFYLAPTTDASRVCVIQYQPHASTGMSCGEVEQASTAGVYLAAQDRAGDPVILAVLMPDGWTTLTSGSLKGTAHDNLAVVTGDVADAATISGAGVATVRLKVGPFARDPAVPAVGSPVSPPAGFPAGVSGGRQVATSGALPGDSAALTPVPTSVSPRVTAAKAYAACTGPAALCPRDAAPTVTLAYATSINGKPLHQTLVWALTWKGLPCPPSAGQEIDDRLFSLSPEPTPVSCRQLMLVDATSGAYLFTETGG
jgi:hypothetical protein